MTRREFVNGLGAAGAVGLLPTFAAQSPEARLAASVGSDGYEVVVLGDTHFDTEPAEVYHANYDEKTEWLNRVQRAEFARNGEMWRERCPRLLKRAAANVTGRTAFVLQTGDLIQGDCGDGAVHAKMLDDVMNRFKRELGGLPFVTVTGNHDIRGKDAAKAYDGYMPKRLSRELGRPVESVDFMFTQGDDAWVVVDFNRPNAKRIDRLLDAAEDARRLFFVSHAPVIPSDGPLPRWMFCGKQADLRRHFRARLARRNAIVLAGHTHRQELMDWRGDGGRITQFVMNSVWSKAALAVAKVRAEGVARYGEFQKKRMTNPNGKPAPDESPLFDEYRPGMVRYFSENAAGSYVLRVTDAAVSVACFGGDSSVARAITLVGPESTVCSKRPGKAIGTGW